ncbi:hypothetical protein PORY_000014 [Pneumocystis oryctolagi]|uniref:Uncharacterized protein n=1 Tax=Pneumocystis oryctolagi TaxID=42067 RepID=A0ACB7CEM5_9ASCO|nr:hypothetical protein PORY_000014 [Pneumocystis oryctolagi]
MTSKTSSPLFFPESSSSIQPTNDALESGNATPKVSVRSGNSYFYKYFSNTPRSIRRGDIHPGHILSTPLRISSTQSSHVTSDIHTMSALGSASENTSETVRMIWGTNVSIQESMNTFKTFLKQFRRKYRMVFDGNTTINEEGDDLVYVDMLKQMYDLDLTNLNLDVRDLESYPPTKKLTHQLQAYPQEIIPIMDQTIKEYILDILIDDHANEAEISKVENNIYKVRPFGFSKTTNIRDLNPNDIDKLVSIKGLVIRSTPIIPDMKQAFFRCDVCHHTVTVEIDRGRISEPTRCPREICSSDNSMQIVHNRSEFADKQVIKLQETPDEVPDGQTPHSVSLCVYDELVDFARAGDRIKVTGIFRSVPVRVNLRQRTIKSLFKTYFDVVHIQKIDKRRIGIDPSILQTEISEFTSVNAEVRKFSEEEEMKIKNLSKNPDLYSIFTKSIAPSIYEMDDVKKGILLQLFGGSNKEFLKGTPRFRGEINVLLCGDPSTSKSQLLQYVHKISPRGVYTSGKGSSAVGLTAYITRDQDTKQLVLESGALVLSDGGICCIDEFDKMSDSTRSVLHEVMEQQTISIAKAGIITTLNARTSILASANPIGSKYNPDLSVPQNIDLPPTLLSRFDLVYLILDKIDEFNDRRLARHLVEMYMEDKVNESKTPLVPFELLTSYISYAKQNIHPVLNKEAADELVRAYIEMRKLGEDFKASEKRITATTRQLESMIRLSEAHAKMRLSNEVNLQDVQEAVRLMKSAIKDYATDASGRIDMDLIYTGEGVVQRRAKNDLKRELLKLLDEMTIHGLSIKFTDLFKKFSEQSTVEVNLNEFNEALRSLEADDSIRILGEGTKRLLRRNFISASDVLNLNEKTFNETIQKDGLFLVKFFAPWCGHCKALAPAYEEAATTLKEKNIVLIKVDCTVETRLCETYGIEGYPTLKVFRNGQHTPYEGPRKASSIVSYMIKQSLPVVTRVNQEDYERFKESDEIVLLALIEETDLSTSDLYLKLATSYRNKYVFGVSSDVEIAKKLKVNFPSVVMFKKHDDVYVSYRGRMEYSGLEVFINSESLPLFGELRSDTYENYISSKVPIGCIFVTSEEERKNFETLLTPLSLKYRGRVSLVSIDANIYGAHAENLNLKQIWPAFAIQETVSNKKFPFSQSSKLDIDSIDKFLSDYVSGRLSPTIKSEPVPKTQDGPVDVVVADSFYDVVIKSKKDVLLEFYAPWCGHCKNLAPKYDSLGMLFRTNSDLNKNVIIAKIDATANDIDSSLNIKGFPTIMLFPAHDKGNPIEYSGPRTIESLIEFIHQKGHYKVNAMEHYLSKPLEQKEYDSSDAGPIGHDEL